MLGAGKNFIGIATMFITNGMPGGLQLANVLSSGGLYCAMYCCIAGVYWAPAKGSYMSLTPCHFPPPAQTPPLLISEGGGLPGPCGLGRPAITKYAIASHS